mmetsp:Transcript_2701/g.2979  ORF Transcript_2701/g.2979 Transcript_2701/m.2979 type:complete len:99 (+) Transcript_2701:104-400(+)
MRGRQIKITLEQLRIASKVRKGGNRRGNPVCHDETMKILNGLEAANFDCAPLYKYVKEANVCFDKARTEMKRGKATTLYHLSKYLKRDKTKIKQSKFF